MEYLRVRDLREALAKYDDHDFVQVRTAKNKTHHVQAVQCIKPGVVTIDLYARRQPRYLAPKKEVTNAENNQGTVAQTK